MRDSLVRDRFICGSANVAVNEKLLAINGITLELAIDRSRAAGLVKEQMLEQSDEDRVSAMQKSESQEGSRSQKSDARAPSRSVLSASISSSPDLGNEKKCFRCGYPSHGARRCPAIKKPCHEGAGHFSSMFHNRTMRTAEVQQVAVAAVEDSPVEDEIVYSKGPTAEPVTVTDEVRLLPNWVFT